MNISLTPELEEYIHNKVKSGLYSSASEVVREALRAHGRAELMAQLQQGMAGPFTPLDLDEIKSEGRKKMGLLS
jgi:antitoxin ParD1/3/4